MNVSRLLLPALAAMAALVAYLKLGRPRVLNWGATPEEAAGAMPGDEILPDAVLQTTRCTTVDASPEQVWPWIVQMGGRPRAGAYTYDWIERLLGIDIENRDQILPEFQHLEEGQFLALGSGETGVEVREVAPNDHLVLQWIPDQSTWTFGLYPTGDGRTRLISRNRLRRGGPFFWPAMALFMEPGSLVMERKMLLGIRERAEALARGEVEYPVPEPQPAAG